MSARCGERASSLNSIRISKRRFGRWSRLCDNHADRPDRAPIHSFGNAPKTERDGAKASQDLGMSFPYFAITRCCIVIGLRSVSALLTPLSQRPVEERQQLLRLGIRNGSHRYYRIDETKLCIKPTA